MWDMKSSTKEMNFKHPLIVALLPLVTIGVFTYMTEKVDSLQLGLAQMQAQVSGIQAQVGEMNDNIKWIRTRLH